MKKETVEALKKMKYEDFLQTDYWKLRLFYNSQKSHTSSEIQKMVESSISESIDRERIERMDDLPF